MKNEATLLTFRLHDTWYALAAGAIQEAILLPELTPLVETPVFVSGIFNLRGHIVTAIDLGRRLGVPVDPWNLKTAVLVVRVGEKLYGLIVDEALSLVGLAPDELEAPPELSRFQPGRDEPFISKIGKIDGRLVPVLDLERLLSAVEQGNGGPAGATAPAAKDARQ